MWLELFSSHTLRSASQHTGSSRPLIMVEPFLWEEGGNWADVDGLSQCTGSPHTPTGTWTSTHIILSYPILWRGVCVVPAWQSQQHHHVPASQPASITAPPIMSPQTEWASFLLHLVSHQPPSTTWLCWWWRWQPAHRGHHLCDWYEWRNQMHLQGIHPRGGFLVCLHTLLHAHQGEGHTTWGQTVPGGVQDPL